MRNLAISFSWLIKEKEFTNYFYDLSPLNKKYLANFVAEICNVDFNEVNNFFYELESDLDLKMHVREKLKNLKRGEEISEKLYFGRRVAWYAFVRILKPQIVVETGTDKGFGTLILAKALNKNQSGTIFTLDLDPFSGALLTETSFNNIVALKGESISLLKDIERIDLFIHDSNHEPQYEYSEFQTILDILSPNAVVISDNSHVSDSLIKWSQENKRRFHFIREESINHWHPGDGIGVSLPQN